MNGFDESFDKGFHFGPDVGDPRKTSNIDDVTTSSPSYDIFIT